MTAHFPQIPKLAFMSPMPNVARLSLVAITLISIFGASPVQAQGSGDPIEGQRIAAQACSGCHQIDLRARDSINDAIPSFQMIAAMPSTTLLTINVFLRTSHEVMPNVQLTETEMSNIGAYILSLRGQLPK